MNIECPDTHIHFIGIGGIGMSALAEVSLQLGFHVSGSDMNNSSNVKKLKDLGAEIFIGHERSQVGKATVVVYSSAISKENPEYDFALINGIPVMKRAELLADLMRLKRGIAVAGTHGKTTTTSIIATLLKETEGDPTYIIGGIVKNLRGHAYVGKGDYIVAEADESDGSFLLLNPVHSVITNIDNDHIDYYESEENLFTAFKEFANKIPFYGTCALNIDDKKLCAISEKMHKPFITFGLESDRKDINYKATEVKYINGGVSFEILHNGLNQGAFFLETPGDHNVLNALGAVAICHQAGVSFDHLREALKAFSGVGRRFQKVFEHESFHVIDDYGHHPTEILETIKTARKSRAESKLVVLFEPHRFTRTKSCWAEFLHCFNGADKLYMAPIYPASEKPIPGITTESLVSDINKLHPSLAEGFEDWTVVSDLVKQLKNQNATLLVLGAGAVGSRVKEIVEAS